MAAIVGAPPGGRVWHERALELAESSEDPDARRWVGSLLNNMGWAAHEAGRFQQALELFERAADVRAAGDDPGALHIARWAVARAKRSVGRLDEALTSQLALAAGIAQRGADEDGYVSEEIGEILLALGRTDEARSHFAQAHRLLSADPWFGENEKQRLARLGDLDS